MKKLCLLAGMCFLACTVSAQVDKGFRMGVRANLGVNKAGMETSYEESADFAFSYGVDWIAEYNFSPSFFLNTGLGIENLSFKFPSISGTGSAWNAALPIHLGGRFNIGDNSNIFIQAGPQLAYGFYGSDVDWYDGSSSNYYDNVDRFRVSAGGCVGVEFSGFQIGVNVDYGFTGTQDLTIGAGIAYMF